MACYCKKCRGTLHPLYRTGAQHNIPEWRAFATSDSSGNAGCVPYVNKCEAAVRYRSRKVFKTYLKHGERNSWVEVAQLGYEL